MYLGLTAGAAEQIDDVDETDATAGGGDGAGGGTLPPRYTPPLRGGSWSYIYMYIYIYTHAPTPTHTYSTLGLTRDKAEPVDGMDETLDTPGGATEQEEVLGSTHIPEGGRVNP